MLALPVSDLCFILISTLFGVLFGAVCGIIAAVVRFRPK